MSNHATDFLGHLVSIGDRVAVVFREEKLRIGVVEDFGSRKYMGYDVPTVEMKWEKCSDGMPDSGGGYFHLNSRIFLKLFDES